MRLEDLRAKANEQKQQHIQGQYLGAIDYKGEKIAQYHNPNLFIEDILGENSTKQFTSIMIIGTPGTGKTVLKNFIAHETHTRDPSYHIYNFGRKELQNFDKEMTKLPNRNLVLCFDDVSLALRKMKDPEQKDRILQTLTEARHPAFEQTDRKIIVISVVHYQNSLEKMWRSQGGWKFYTDLSDEEAQVFNALTKGRFKKKVQLFGSTTLKQFRKKEFTVSLTNKQQRTYKINEPFRFVMCYDTSSIRFFLVPNESCNLCDPKKDRIPQIRVTPREVIMLMQKYYGKHGKAGLKLALNEVGNEEQFPNRTINAKRIAIEILQNFNVDRTDLALTMRKDARIKSKALYTIRKKKVDLYKDILDMRSNEGKITFASEIKENDIGELDLDEIEL